MRAGKMLDTMKRFKKLWYTVVGGDIVNNKLYFNQGYAIYLAGLIEGVEMSKDTIEASQIREIVESITSK